MVQIFNEDNFNSEVLEAKGVVLVDIFATWCGPCKMLSPIVDNVAEEVENVKVGKVNIDENTDLATEYGVRSVPTLLYFRDGELKEKIVGLQSKDQILSVLNSIK